MVFVAHDIETVARSLRGAKSVGSNPLDNAATQQRNLFSCDGLSRMNPVRSA